MATLNLTTSVSGLGTANSWTTAATTAIGEQHGVVPYLGASVSSSASSGWTIGAITGGGAVDAALAATTSIAFTAANTPTSWTAGTGVASGPVLTTATTYKCTLYWTDASGVQQYAYGVPLTLTIAAGVSHTWAAGSVNCYYASANLAAQSSSAATVTNIVVCPEVITACDIVGNAVASDSITGLTISSSRTGLAALCGAIAGGTNASSSTTTFTFGTVDVGAVAAIDNSYSIVIMSVTGAGMLVGTYAVSTVGSLPTSVVLGSSPGTAGTAISWFATKTALADRTYLSQLVGPYNGLAYTGVLGNTSNPVYALAQTARTAGAIIHSTADTSSAVAPSICSYHA
jgi:hypothetical protein